MAPSRNAWLGIPLPLGLTPYMIAFFAVLVAAFIVFRRVEVPPLSFNTSAFLNIGEVFAPLLIVAAFIERAVEIVLTPLRGDGAESLQAQIKAAGPGAAADRLREELIAYRAQSRRYAVILAVSLGLLASLLGIRGLQSLLADGADPGRGFVFLDIILTGLVVGGGADGIHKVVSAFTSYMDMVSRKAREA